MGIRLNTYTSTIVMEQPSSATRRTKKGKAAVPQQEIFLDEMPFISFDQPGADSDGEKQKVIRKHLGRRRKKMTPTRENSKRSRKELIKQDSPPATAPPNMICTCLPYVHDFAQAAACDGRAIVLELCLDCGRPRLVENISQPSTSMVASPESQVTSPMFFIASPMSGSIAENSLDPFGMLPMNVSPRSHGLIKHFINVTAPTSLPIPRFASLFPNIVGAMSLMAHDETLLQAAVGLAAMHVDWLQGKQGLSTSALEERGKAISLLNKNLTRPTDGVILAIVLLGCCEMVAGNHESWKAHVLGLKNLLEMRGSLEPCDPIRDSVLEIDTVGCTIFRRQPFFTSFVNLDQPMEHGASDLPYEFVAIDAELRQTFAAIRYLAAAMEPYVSSDTIIFGGTRRQISKERMDRFVMKRSVIEYRLLTIHCAYEDNDDADANEDDENSERASRVLALGAGIFTNLVLRKQPRGGMIHTPLAASLRNAILSFDQHPAAQHATSLLLWASVMGCMAIPKGPMRTWFLGWVAHCLSELDICGEVDLQYHLNKFVWIESILGGYREEMSKELEEMGRMGVDIRFIGEGDP